MSQSAIQIEATHRRSFIGGSDARIIMGSDEAALVKLWREKRGEAVTTAIDRIAGMVNLITSLRTPPANGSHRIGRFVAIAETANPQRMGAALTYARRYALFTLVGIAGEDDLNAPDLCDGPRSPAPPADERSLKPGHGQPPVQQRKPRNGQRRYGIHGDRPSTLEPEQSVALREKLLTAVGSITSADNASIWAREALAAKNRLAAADAKLVEDAFGHRLSELAPSATAGAARRRCSNNSRGACWRPMKRVAKGNDDVDQAEGIDKSVLVIATPRRYRNREHLRYVGQQACSHLRPQAIRSASSSLPATAGARPQGQR